MRQITLQTSEAMSTHDESGVGRVGNSDVNCPTTICAAGHEGHEGHEGHVMPPDAKPPVVKPGKDKPAAPSTPPASKLKEKKSRELSANGTVPPRNPARVAYRRVAPPSVTRI